ncbi:MAG: AraC family transcriptional regulator [Steroidobacteraceae bacterium]|nr:AraC family transcriptional regulator [Steroidobacteraceae bacterium]
MYELDIALRVAVVSQLIFAIGLLFRAGWPLSRARTAAVALVIAVAAYMYCSMGSHEPSLIILPIVGLCILIPPVFWLFAQAAFDDDFRFKAVHAAGFLVALVLGFGTFLNSESPMRVVTGLASRLLSLVFILSALWIAFRSRRMDLVESRRKFRDWLTAIVGLYMLGVIAAEIALLGKDPSPLVSTLNVAAILVVSHLACHGLSSARVHALEAIPKPAPPPPATPPSEEQRLLEQLRVAMEENFAYRENGLSIAALAGKVGVPEHVLRRLINQRLGFRNFNEFLNRYRLRDACARLRTPGMRSLPILTIALDVGYNSITPFNRAFKELVGMTPTQYREAENPPTI